MIAKVKVRQVDTPEQNRALGVVCGRYLPAADDLSTGAILLTSDSTLLPAVLLSEPLKKFEKNPTLLDNEQYFLAYPSWLKESPHLRLELFRLRLASTKKRKSRFSLDLFDIRGYITKVQKRKRLITVRVYRNEAFAQNPKTRSYKQLEIIGTLETSTVKQLWGLVVRRKKDFLWLEQATAIR